MNWNTYKTLTVQQKEEYNFRFKNKEYFDLKGILTLFLLFITTTMLLLMILFIIVTNELFDSFKDKIDIIVDGTAQTANLMFWVLIISLSLNILNIIVLLFLEYKWRKKEGIKYIPFWKKDE